MTWRVLLYPMTDRVKFKNSFLPSTFCLWNYLLKQDQCKDLLEFKTFTNLQFKPARYKHFVRGNKFTLLTKIRVGRSDLNQHKFIIGLADSPECQCHFREESPTHFFLDCFLYLPERQTLFDLIEHYIPKFKRLTKQKKLDIILRGIDIENNDFIQLNTKLTIAVQNFVLHTNRFS